MTQPRGSGTGGSGAQRGIAAGYRGGPWPTPNTFEGARLDRVTARRRDAGWVAERSPTPPAAPSCRRDGRARGRRARWRWWGCRRAGAEPLLLGVQDGRALFAVDAATRPRWRPRARSPRHRAALAQDDGGLIAYAAALLNWHRRHRFCSVCGHPSRIERGRPAAPLPGLRRRAPPAHRPRRDHARGRRASATACCSAASRAGRRAATRRWRASSSRARASRTPSPARCWRSRGGGRRRALRLLAAVAVPELADARLHGAYVGGEPVASDGELEDARWFTRAELWRRPRGRGEMRLPPPVAIARTLIDGWLAARDDRRGGAPGVVPGTAGRDRGDAVRARHDRLQGRGQAVRAEPARRRAAGDLAQVRARPGGGAAARPRGRASRLPPQQAPLEHRRVRRRRSRTR